MRRLIITLFVLYTSTAFSQSLDQQVIITDGDEVTNGGTTLSWTLGQPFGGTYSTGSGYLTEGFQQGDLLITTVESTINNIRFKVYPNPAVDIVFIEGDSEYSVSVTDMSGKLIRVMEVNKNIANLDLSSFSGGSYLIIVTDKRLGSRSTYKIEKLN